MKNVVKVTALSLGLALASGFAAADENIRIHQQRVTYSKITQIVKL